MVRAHAADAPPYVLVKDGEPRCAVIVPARASVVERHAADELRQFLNKVSGAEVAERGHREAGLFSIFLGTPATCPEIGSFGVREEVERLSSEGFLLQADDRGLLIAGRTPRGVLYGVYAFLEEQIGLRWFFPGEAGEYCPSKPTVAIGRIRESQEPAFTTRSLCLTCTSIGARMIDTWNWMVRNRMQIRAHSKHIYRMHPEEFAKRDAVAKGGGHVLKRLVSDSLFEGHPEYFGLVRGQRLRQARTERGVTQPCTSHPRVIDLAERGIVSYFNDVPRGGLFYLGNNDGSGWCECRACAALDPAWERKRSLVPTRFYTFTNAVCQGVHRQCPNAELWGWGYQAFQQPPTRVEPDPRLRILIALHGRCFRHSLGDTSCPANEKYRSLLGKWLEFGNEIIAREYYSCFVDTRGPTPDSIVYLSMERIVAEDILYHHRIGMRGWIDEVPPPDGRFGPAWDRREIRESWRARFRIYYVAAKLLWNPRQNVDELLRDLDEKVYGPAASAMAKYRALLGECWRETPGHFTYGTPYASIGRCLARPGAKEQLLACLAEAQEAARGSKLVLVRIALDREYLALAWERTYHLCQAMPSRDVHVRRRERAIEVDGALDEEDWKRVDYVTGFSARVGRLAEHQTFVRMLYDPEYVYLAIEAQEPLTDQLRIDHHDRDCQVWKDDDIELFMDPQGAGECYYHLVVNPVGALYDAKCELSKGFEVEHDVECDIATKVMAGKWVVEMRLRASSLGTEIRDGDRWKATIGRMRRAGGARESSTWMDGSFHQPASFRAVVFGDQGVIQNGGFEDVFVLDTKALLRQFGRKGWRYGTDPPRLPRSWYLHDGHPGSASLVEDGAHSGRRAWRIEDGWVHQRMTGQLSRDQSIRVQFWARGQGKMTVAVYLYRQAEDDRLRFEKTDIVERIPLKSEWQAYQLAYSPSPQDPRVGTLAFWVDGVAVLDDVHVTGGR